MSKDDDRGGLLVKRKDVVDSCMSIGCLGIEGMTVKGGQVLIEFERKEVDRPLRTVLESSLDMIWGREILARR